MDTTTPNYPLPTAQVDPYVEAIGTEATIDLLLNFGGADLAISVCPKGAGMLERVVGLENAKKLAENAHKFQRRVPLASRWLAQCLYAQGLSQAAIARRLRISDVTIHRYVRGKNAPNHAVLK